MMKKFTVFILPLLLMACAGGPARTPQDSTAPEETPAPVEAAVLVAPMSEAAPLSGEMLFRLLAAEIAGQRGQVAVSAQQYYLAAEMSRDLEIVERAARIAVYARDHATALKLGQLWLTLEPDSIQAYTVIATSQIKLALYDDAYHTLDRLLTLTDQRGYHFIFTLLGRQEDKQAALALLEKLMQGHGQTDDALLAYGRLALLADELDKASAAGEELLAMRPEWEEAQQLWVNLLLRQDRNDAALAYLQATLQTYPQSNTLRMFYARKLVDEKRLPEAHEQFKLLLQQDDSNSDARYALGLISLELKRLDEAETYFKALYKDEARASESAYYLGLIAEQRKNKESAMRWYSLVSMGNHYIEAQIRIAAMLAEAGDLAAARTRLQNIEATTVSVELRLYLAEGDILRMSKRYREAFDLYTEALAKMPDNAQLLYARAMAAEKIDLLAVTLQDLKSIIKREPENVQALNALGYTLADRTERYADALEYISAAYRLNSTDPAIIDSLGWVHYRLGNHEKALQYLQQAFDLVKDPEIGAHLGEVLWVMGRQQQAQKVWDEALQTKPEHPLLLDVIKRFTKP
ncbi:MAG: tetratricopeptide repeat protein [Gammaproteobacteria bacterium]